MKPRLMVLPGASPGGVIVIRRELEVRHQDHGTQWIRTVQGNTPDEIEAQRWAKKNSVPLVAAGRPDSIIMARNLTEISFPIPTDAERLWQEMGKGNSPSLWSITADIIRMMLVPRQVMCLNTGHWQVVETLAAQRARNHAAD